MTCVRGAVAAVVAIALVALVPPAHADSPPRGSEWSEAYFESRDGTRLHADVFRPAGLGEGDATPAMLVVSPYLGDAGTDGSGPPKVLDWYRGLYEAAIARGYSIVQVAFRGTGASGGCSDFGGAGEQGDVAAAVDWAASRAWASGRVGIVGHSYDGFGGIVAISQHVPALRAAVLIAPAFDLYRGVFMNGVAYAQGPAVAPYYQLLGLVSPSTGRDPVCSFAISSAAQDPDHASGFWRERDFGERAAHSRVPVMWTHGFLDGRDDYSATRPDNFLAVWSRLAGPKRAWFGQFPHVVPGESNTWGEPEPVGRGGFTADALDWLDAHVKGDEAARSRTLRAPAVAVQDGSDGGWRAEPDWPPVTRGRELPLLPGEYADAAGNKAEQGDGPGGGCAEGLHARCNPLSRTGVGTWTFSTPFTDDVHLAGVARLRVTLRPGGPAALVVAIVYDVDPDSRATLLTRGAARVPPDGRVEFDLYPQDWRLRAGHRIGVLLAGSDDFYFEPGRTNSRVAVEAGSLRVPLVAGGASGRPLEGGPSRAVEERTSFPVDPATVAARTSAFASASEPSPPRGHPLRRLVLRVWPRRARARRAAVLRITTLDGRGRRVLAARVRVGRRLLRTVAHGSLRVRVTFTRPGRHVLRASAPGYSRARAHVRVRR